MSKTATVAKHETLNDFPEVKAREAKATELLGLLRERDADLESALQEKSGGVAEAARKLLAGEPSATPDIAALRHSVEVTRAAHKMAEADWLQARIRAAGELCEEYRGEHGELVERIENAFLELLDSLREENQFFHRFLSMGIQQPSFSRPYLANHPALLRQFLSVKPDEFRA